MKKLKVVILGIILIAISIIALNFISLQRHMMSVLSEDPRNKGISVWVHYKWFINPMELKYDLRSVSGENSQMDVARVMLQFAEKIHDKKFNKVYLSYKGTDKFYFKGTYFQDIGAEYGIQNPIYTLRTMPENFYTLDGDLKYGQWTGGWLGVVGKQMEDLNSFSKDWYINDIAKY